MTDAIKDSNKGHWVNRSPANIRPYLQLSRLDRPIGYWLLALPGWIGLAFATLSHGFAATDFKWAALILIGAIAMRGTGCTYNDIVDQDLDAKVERTALRPLPAGTISNKQAWIWLMAQCGIGLIVLLMLPRLAQYIALGSIPLVAAYPFMKRITWWPQVWLGFTFNWAVLVAYAAKTGEMTLPVFILYAGLIFWTIGYDTIYACQDIEDDAIIGVKSTARRFGSRVKLGIGVCYLMCVSLVMLALLTVYLPQFLPKSVSSFISLSRLSTKLILMALALPFAMHLAWQVISLKLTEPSNALKKFKSNFWAAILLIVPLIWSGGIY